MRLTDQVAVVTGAASGIGRAVAHALAREGAVAVSADLDLDGARATAGAIESGGGRAEAVRADVTDSGEVSALVNGVRERHGRLDVLVNNAGSCQVKPLLDLAEDDLRRMWEVHALGSFRCAQAAARTMRERGYGRIVNVVSGPGGYGASATTAHYQAAKSAQTSFARSMALTLGREGITVNCVSPGLVVTSLWEKLDADVRRTLGKSATDAIAERLEDAESFPLGRAVTADEVADVVVFLALPGTGAITGEVINL